MEPEKRDRKPEAEEDSSVLPYAMCMGLAIGTAIGGATGSLGMWMALGVAIGGGLGSALDVAKKKTAPASKTEPEEDAPDQGPKDE